MYVSLKGTTCYWDKGYGLSVHEISARCILAFSMNWGYISGWRLQFTSISIRPRLKLPNQ
ncbi:uncharacterized protein EI90DRAFT_651316 [Cantharellus anzutake]|uniref:uncharacterized protein n=1 Tax=Cantharellus anzutake TaxID=1750568 RepID=UPI0019052F7A|nr:uncharacterized protein EI90DRAFT_651316 [Cantharellus anzutake]KAF8312735.1 hypothetical protein EI90DRAFT_651316 [Cantharellus anzutake]